MRKKTYEKHKELRRKDHQHRLRHSLRERCRQLLIGKVKPYSYTKSIGCTYEELVKYIESKFTEGMNWDNYGRKGWHIDHIKPCASFDLSNYEQQKQCFHYTNLQPFWWKDNLEKAAKC